MEIHQATKEELDAINIDMTKFKKMKTGDDVKYVYVVTDGDYSDYHIMECFSTKQKAKDFIELIGEGQIEKYPLDPQFSFKKNYKSYDIHMKKNGDIVEIYNDMINDCNYKDSNTFKFLAFPTKCGYDIIITINTNTEERAIKIANELRSAILSTNHWGDREKLRTLGFKC